MLRVFIYLEVVLVTSSPFLNTLHLNCCFLGIEHISLLLDISLKNKYLDDPPTYKSPGINTPAAAPVIKLNNMSDALVMHCFMYLIPISINK